MSRHRRAVDRVIEMCRAADPGCGVQLQGSVARGEEREGSDVDVTVVLGRPEPLVHDACISPTNRYRMIRVRRDDLDVGVDINWPGADELLEVVRTLLDDRREKPGEGARHGTRSRRSGP